MMFIEKLSRVLGYQHVVDDIKFARGRRLGENDGHIAKLNLRDWRNRI